MATGRSDGASRSHNVPLKLAPPARPPAAAANRKQDPRMPPPEESRKRRCLKCLYNKETNEFCTRTCTSWILILSYSAMYLIFLATYTLVILYLSLMILKQVIDFSKADNVKLQFLKYPGIGLTATPTSENSVPVIWYKKGEKSDYYKYVQAIDKFLSTNRRKREVSSLGPCGEPPYGYGEEPCVIIRINKRFNWVGQPLDINSTEVKLAPAEVQEWVKADRSKLWLQCSGYHSYDKEHIGKIKYYPDPPGFDANAFPLDADKKSPLVAVQISEFTIGISLAITCKLWYESGSSIIDFVLYVAPGERTTNTSVNL